MDDLAEASKSITTLKAMMDQDVQADCVRRAGSHTRNLLRVKRGLDMVKVLFEQIIASEYAYYLFSFMLIFTNSWKSVSWLITPENILYEKLFLAEMLGTKGMVFTVFYVLIFLMLLQTLTKSFLIQNPIDYSMFE